MRASFAILFSIACLSLSGQNLVRNGSFEPVDCPSTGTGLSQIAPPWIESPTSVNHFGPCSDPGAPNTNNNIPPRTGDGNIGLYVYGIPNAGTSFLRGYALGELSFVLQEGQLYRVSYWIHPVYVAQVGLNAGVDAPGFSFFEFRSDVPSFANNLIEVDNATYPASPITNLNGWTQVCLQYRAIGNERYIALGNFRTDANTMVQQLANGNVEEGYYLIDDLVVEAINEPILSGTTNICPNGTVTLTVPDGLNQGMWEDGTIETTREITEPGIYSYSYQDGICLRTDQVEVVSVNCTECSIYFASAFTPNGDGLNDSWSPIFECDPIEYRIEIFDRIGNLMFRSFDWNEEWAPQNSDQEGTYVYKLQVTYELFGDNAYINETGEVSIVK